MDDRVRRFARHGVEWRVEETTVPQTGADGKGGHMPSNDLPALCFESVHGSRYLYEVPSRWRELDDAALAALLPTDR